MDWSAGSVLLLALLIALQGCWGLRRGQSLTRPGWLAISLAAPAILWSLLTLQARLTFSPEFLLAMVQGRAPARFGLGLLFAGLALFAGLCCHVIRGGSQKRFEPWALLVGGVITGGGILWRVTPLDPWETSPHQVYAYALASPLLLAWLAGCATLCAAESGRVFYRAVREAWRTGQAPRLQPSHSHAGVRWLLLSIPVSVGLAWLLPDADAGLPLLVTLLFWSIGWELDWKGPVSARLRREAPPSVPAAVPDPAAPVPPRAGALEGLKQWANPRALLSAGLKLMAGVALLVTLGEVLNAGKTLIQPFKVIPLAKAASPGSPSIDTAGLGAGVADHLMNALGSLQRELQPETLLLRPVGSVKGFSLSISPQAAPGLNADYARGVELELGSVKIPFELVIEPLRNLMRAVMGVRVIHGSLHEEQAGYTLLAQSSLGETWRVHMTRTELCASIAEGRECTREPLGLQDAVPHLTQQLAFKLLSADPVLESNGGTHSWDAFLRFREGLAHWRRFDERSDYAALTQAIQEFRAALQRDQLFALAHYRLGLALLQDGQTSSAIDAFRGSLQSNPRFVPGQLSLALSLSFDSARAMLRTTVASPPARSHTTPAMWLEARRLFQDIVRPPEHAPGVDRAQAYLGLCQIQYWLEENGQPLLPLAYFYCRQAEREYARLSREQRSVDSVRVSQASAQYWLGMVLEQSGSQPSTPAESPQWVCDPELLVQDPGSPQKFLVRLPGEAPLRRAALRHYERAARLASDPVLRCRTAMAAFMLGDASRLNALTQDVETHMLLGRSLRARAKNEAFAGQLPRAQALYRKARDHFYFATVLDPTNPNAKNSFIYTLWESKYHTGEAVSPDLPSDFDQLAEQYARQAVAEANTRIPLHLRIQTYSSLGELLISLGRPEEAIEVLEFIHSGKVAGLLEPGAAVAPLPPMFDEVRWDLAQAYRCAARNALSQGNEPGALRLQTKAAGLLEEVLRHDVAREDKLFPDSAYEHFVSQQSLDPRTVPRVCEPSPGASAPPGLAYGLGGTQPVYASAGICEWMGLRAGVAGAPPSREKKVWLHVWGREVNRRVPVGPEPSPDVLLGYTPESTRGTYFVQLEDPARNPLSRAYPVETFANSADGRCPKNLIQLTFEPLPQGGQAPAQQQATEPRP